MPIDPRIIDVAKNVNEELFNRTVRHAIWLEGLKEHELRRMVGYLNRDVFPELLGRTLTQLERLKTRGTGAFTLKRYQDMLDAQATIIRQGFSRLYVDAKRTMGDLAITEGDVIVAMLERAIPLDITYTLPSAAVLRSKAIHTPIDGRFMREWFADLSRNTRKKVNEALRTGIMQGETSQQLIRRLKATGGPLNWTRHQMATFARTAIGEISNAAARETFMANKRVIKAERYVATLDGRTTLICIDLDGYVIRPVGGSPRPPQHPNCRSRTSPIVKTWEELGIKGLKEPPESVRAALGGPVPQKMTYPAWLKTQSEAMQRRVLGRTRFDLWKAGKEDISGFVNRGRNIISVKTLRKRHKLPPLRAG